MCSRLAASLTKCIFCCLINVSFIFMFYFLSMCLHLFVADDIISQLFYYLLQLCIVQPSCQRALTELRYPYTQMRLSLQSFKGLIIPIILWPSRSKLERFIGRLLCSHTQMVLISGGEFLMGTDNPGIPADGESPQRLVQVDSFHMDVQEVTNRQFQSFVGATGYVTEVWDNFIRSNHEVYCEFIQICLIDQKNYRKSK